MIDTNQILSFLRTCTNADYLIHLRLLVDERIHQLRGNLSHLQKPVSPEPAAATSAAPASAAPVETLVVSESLGLPAVSSELIRSIEAILQPAPVGGVEQKDGYFLVPSESGQSKYTVILNERASHCTCPASQFDRAGKGCKHLESVRVFLDSQSKSQKHDAEVVAGSSLPIASSP